MPDLRVSVGRLPLKNPVIAGSGEHTTTSSGMRAALAAGAAAVIAKSTNETEAGRRQLDGADYVLLDSRWRLLPWDFDPPPDAQLFCRSGLLQEDFEPFLARLVALDAEARRQDAYVIPSLILADLETCAGFVERFERAGLRAVEVNIGAPHGDEAAAGAIVQEREAARVREITARVRRATALPLWIKLTGQSENVAALAAAARDGGADAVIIMGRFMAFVPDVETRAPVLGTPGAIGGPWALPLTCRWLALARRHLGKDFSLLATNGARSGLDVARFLLAGASAVEMTSAVMTRGFRVIDASLQELVDYLTRQNCDARSLIGEAADELQGYGEQQARPGYWRNFVPPEARD
jgi:dihydroorotate dehydrogenase